MAIITRFGGSGGGTPIVDPYPHVWECTVVQSGTTGVVSGVVTLEAYDILHYTMPLGFSTYDLMIGGVTYHTSFRNEGEMYIQWTGSDFVVVSANAACALSHVWTSPTYTITGTVLEITGGVDDLHTNDVIVLTLASGESASNIEYNSQVYTIDLAISEGTNYVQFNGTTFDNALFNFKGDATASDVVSGKTFYSNTGTLLTGILNPVTSPSLFDEIRSVTTTGSSHTATFTNLQANKCVFALADGLSMGAYASPTSISITQNGDDVSVVASGSNNVIIYAFVVKDEYIYDNTISNSMVTESADTSHIIFGYDRNILTDYDELVVYSTTTFGVNNANNWFDQRFRTTTPFSNRIYCTNGTSPYSIRKMESKIRIKKGVL